MSTISSFKSIENKYDVYRGRDCMEKFFKSLREHAMEIINFKKKKMIINRILNDYSVINRTAAEICFLCKEKIKDKHAKDRKYHKVRDH